MNRAGDPRSSRVESASAFNLFSPGGELKFANDSLGQSSENSVGGAAKRPYVTRSRAEAVQQSLGPRDRAILETVALLGIASGDQLQRSHYEQSEAGRRLARKDLARLCQLGVLARLGRSVGGQRAGSRGHVIVIGQVGQRIIWPNRRRYRQPWTPNPAFVTHALAVSELYVRLRLAAGDSLLTFESEPRCWRHYFGPGERPPS